MGSLIYYAVLFLAKVLDNALSTTKTILIQRSRWLLAGIAVVLSDFIYFWLTKRIVSGDNNESKFYLIGEGHKEFLADKTRDLDYYVLALAAIARELNIRKMTCGKIRIAAGLPLTWVSGQRDEFRDYLMQNKAVDFSFRNVFYHVEIVGVDVFPQGFAAVADRLSDFRGVNMICDIGNGTMNIMFINDKKPVSGNMFTEKYGTHQCLLAVRENVMRAHTGQHTFFKAMANSIGYAYTIPDADRKSGFCSL